MQNKQSKRRSKRKATDDKSMTHLESVVRALNSTSVGGEKLRELVTLWQNSGPNTERLFLENEGLRYRISEVWRNFTTLEGTRTGAVQLDRFRGDIGEDAERLEGGLQTRVDGLFVTLVTNILWHKLAGPCGRCGKYYLKRKASQTVYCSRACGNAATAAKRTSEKFQDLRREKLARVRAALLAWDKKSISRTTSKLDWKRWVAAKAEVDLRFIASAVRKLEIAPPKGK